MRATLNHALPAMSAGPVQGTFYPDAAKGGGSAGPMLPRLLAILATFVLVRAIVSGRRRYRHGMSDPADRPRWGRRREALLRLHRELHAHDDGEVTA